MTAPANLEQTQAGMRIATIEGKFYDCNLLQCGEVRMLTERVKIGESAALNVFHCSRCAMIGPNNQCQFASFTPCSEWKMKNTKQDRQIGSHSPMLTLSAVLVFLATARAVQFLLANSVLGDDFWPNVSLVMDFTVYSPIEISAIGLFDADEPGIASPLQATLVDRSNDLVLITVTIEIGVARQNESNPFVFLDVSPRIRLARGVYSLLSRGFDSDRILTNANDSLSVVTGYSAGDAVLATAALSVNHLNSAELTELGGVGYFHIGATFVFDVISMPLATPLLPSDFRDCEEVACAGLATGMYRIRGQVRFCNNNDQGGGWMRLWRANESTCESNGWTSARNANVSGVDPFGCSATVFRNARCNNGSLVDAPFAFREVLGMNWLLWGTGSLGAFHTRTTCEGVMVFGFNGSAGVPVWALAASAGTGIRLCPCSPGFMPSNDSLNRLGAFWSCASIPQKSNKWYSAFNTNANQGGGCVGGADPRGDITWFQRTMESPISSIVVGLCKNGDDSSEDVKLASGDLFVRSTPGFDKQRQCPMVSIASPVTSILVSSTVARSTAVSSAVTVAVVKSGVGDATTTPSDVLTIGAITGVIVVVLVVVALGGVALVCWKRRATKSITPASPSEYGVLPYTQSAEAETPHYDDVADVRQHANEYETPSTQLS